MSLAQKTLLFPFQIPHPNPLLPSTYLPPTFVEPLSPSLSFPSHSNPIESFPFPSSSFPPPLLCNPSDLIYFFLAFCIQWSCWFVYNKIKISLSFFFLEKIWNRIVLSLYVITQRNRDFITYIFWFWNKQWNHDSVVLQKNITTKSWFYYVKGSMCQKITTKESWFYCCVGWQKKIQWNHDSIVLREVWKWKHNKIIVHFFNKIMIM